jgi:hypothetical protein
MFSMPMNQLVSTIGAGQPPGIGDGDGVLLHEKRLPAVSTDEGSRSGHFPEPSDDRVAMFCTQMLFLNRQTFRRVANRIASRMEF